ncbi:retrovirus-related pol polyprotein from transposon TNT 1-94 [Tanacetum coccineum]
MCKKTVATDSTVRNQKILGMLYEQVSKNAVGGIPKNFGVAFRKSTCYIRDLKGNDLLKGSRGTDLYSITLQDSTSPNLICLTAKAKLSQACCTVVHSFLTSGSFSTIGDGIGGPSYETPLRVVIALASFLGFGMVLLGFSKGSIDPTLFITKHGEDILLVQIYVDDIIFGSTNPKLSKRFGKLMHSKFDMSMMGELKFFLGIQIHQSPRGIFINQAKYAQEILKKHGMTSCDSIGTPMATKHLDADLSGTPVDQTKYRSMVGALMYLTASRPDIVHATCYCARYQAKPTEKHLTAVKRIFRYLKDSINMGLWYPKDTGFELTAFSDLDHAGCLDSRKSTSGDKLVSWSSKKQDCTSMSSAKAEYVSLSACCAQVLWLRTQLTDYGFHFDKIPMYCDSKAAIAISCNPVQHSCTKHIDLADLFTKALSEDRFKYLVRRLDMRCLTLDELEVLAIESA